MIKYSIKESNMSNSNSSSGIGFTGLLTILFIALKLTGHITWSWWWVLAPIWISIIIAIIVIFGIYFSMNKRRRF